MKNILTIIALSLIGFSSCKKLDNVNPNANTNYDVVNNVFRVIATPNADYSAVVIYTAPGAASDTLTTNSSSGFGYNYGFTPIAGSKINVMILSPKGSSMNATVNYKNVKVGGDNVQPAPGGGIELNFDYTVPQ